MKNKDIKNRALKMLNNNWGQAVTVILILLVIHIIIIMSGQTVFNYLQYKGEVDKTDFALITKNKYMIIVNIVRLIIGFIVMTPAFFGAQWWFIHCVRGESNNIKSMFMCYENKYIFTKALALKLTIYLLKLVVALPVCILIVLEYRLIKYTLIRGVSNGELVMLIGCCAIFTICTIGFYIIFALRYALADYIFVLNPDLKIGEIIKTSSIKMKDHKTEIIKLVLSFLWWLPSCVLVFPVFFVCPYFVMAFTVMINNIIEKNFVMERSMLAGNRAPSIVS